MMRNALYSASLCLAVLGCEGKAKKSDESPGKPDHPTGQTDGMEPGPDSESVTASEITIGQVRKLTIALEEDKLAFADAHRYRASLDLLLNLVEKTWIKTIVSGLDTDCDVDNMTQDNLFVLHKESTTTTHALGDILINGNHDMETLLAGTNTLNFMLMNSAPCTVSFDFQLLAYEPTTDGSPSDGAGDSGSDGADAQDDGGDGEDPQPSNWSDDSI